MSDLVFIMDASGSISDQNFLIEKDLMKSLTSMLTIGEYGVRVGVVLFDDEVDEVISLKVG